MVNPPSDEIAIQSVDLRVKRGKTEILHGLSFAIPRGSVTGLLGPSGCGKSTLIRSIVGCQKIQSGKLTINGLPAGHSKLRHAIGYTSQGLGIYPDISVFDNVRYFAGLQGDSTEHASEIIERLGLASYADRKIFQLSGGQANRASLACALVGKPNVLVLDEPTVGLDPLTRMSLWELFDDLAAKGTTLIVSSHVLDEATKCNEVLFLREGQLLAHKPIAQLMSETQTATPEAAFLAMVKDHQ